MKKRRKKERQKSEQKNGKQIWTKMVKMVLNDEKWSNMVKIVIMVKMVQNGPKWSEMVRNGPNW